MTMNMTDNMFIVTIQFKQQRHCCQYQSATHLTVRGFYAVISNEQEPGCMQSAAFCQVSNISNWTLYCEPTKTKCSFQRCMITLILLDDPTLEGLQLKYSGRKWQFSSQRLENISQMAILLAINRKSHIGWRVSTGVIWDVGNPTCAFFT